MSAHPSSWYATTQMERPQGMPGTYQGRLGGTFLVVLDVDGLLWLFNEDKGPTRTYWTPARGWDAARFAVDPEAPEWWAQCPTSHGRYCDSERACDALLNEQGDE